MTTVFEILEFLDTFAPRFRKMEWDNVGLLCGRRDKEVNRILVALDPFEGVAREAAETGADLIITHHPLLFLPAYAVTEDTGIGRTIMTLVRSDISAVNLHTNLDIAPGGVNDVLAEVLGLQNVRILNPTEPGWGLIRFGTAAEQTTEEFLHHVKQALGTPVLRYADGGKTVHLVACGGGACADELREVAAAGCDTFVTSDVKYNDFWDARDLGLTLIDAGHFYTENPICTHLCRILAEAFPDITVTISKTHCDCMKFF